MVLSIRVKEVKPLDNFILSVLFVNGVRKFYDVKKLFEEFPDMFSQIKHNPSIFQNVFVDLGGCGVSWSEDIDISEYELWENGVLENILK